MKFLGFEIKFRHDRYAAARVELERKAREERAAWEAEENDREQAARERETEEQRCSVKGKIMSEPGNRFESKTETFPLPNSMLSSSKRKVEIGLLCRPNTG